MEFVGAAQRTKKNMDGTKGNDLFPIGYMGTEQKVVKNEKNNASNQRRRRRRPIF